MKTKNCLAELKKTTLNSYINVENRTKRGHWAKSKYKNDVWFPLSIKNKSEFEPVCGIEKLMSRLELWKKYWIKKAQLATTYKNNCYFVLNKSQLLFCFCRFSFGKSASLKNATIFIQNRCLQLQRQFKTCNTENKNHWF